jgi:hypothetical protein
MRGVAGVSIGLVLAAAGLVVAQRHAAEPDMTAAARTLLASLDQDQRAKISWPFDSEERFNWHFVPREREGLPLAAMNDRQRQAAFALLRAGLSEPGYRKVEGIRVLEGVLREIEKSAGRDPERYFFTIFGEPGAAAWGWRYEGHHVAQNWTIVGGKATATTPAFLGTNPAEVQGGPQKGLRVLPAEEDLARALVAALTPAQRTQAVTSETAPPDILTGNSRRAGIIDRTGLSAEAMTAEQRQLLMRLIEEHASVQAPGLADQRLARVRRESLADLLFAWAGPTAKAPGNGHYYRIQGRTFLIEYDNTQDDANHQHVVWRDFAGDFGADLLAEHYTRAPHDHGHDARHQPPGHGRRGPLPVRGGTSEAGAAERAASGW